MKWVGGIFFGCRFNAMNFLEKYRGKKIMFVGDSLSLNQFNSLACMIHAWIPNSRTTFNKMNALTSVTFEVSFTHIIYSHFRLFSLIFRLLHINHWSNLTVLRCNFILKSFCITTDKAICDRADIGLFLHFQEDIF